MEIILENVKAMLIHRSQIRQTPAPSQKEFSDSFLVWDPEQKTMVETVVLVMDKFTTKQYNFLDLTKRYIILTDKTIHYELRKQVGKNSSVEVFPKWFFKINLLDFTPLHILCSESISYKKKLPKILTSDPMVLFCGFKADEVILVEDRLCVVTAI